MARFTFFAISAPVALALLLGACSSDDDGRPADASMPDAPSIDSGPDAWSYDASLDASGDSGGFGSCQPNMFGGRDCVGGPCPYPCCQDGALETCFISNGSECGVVMAIDCGGGRCVYPGEECPDGGTGTDAGL